MRGLVLTINVLQNSENAYSEPNKSKISLKSPSVNFSCVNF